MTNDSPRKERTRRTDNGRADRIAEHVITRVGSRLSGWLVVPAMAVIAYFGQIAISDIREARDSSIETRQKIQSVVEEHQETRDWLRRVQVKQNDHTLRLEILEIRVEDD